MAFVVVAKCPRCFRKHKFYHRTEGMIDQAYEYEFSCPYLPAFIDRLKGSEAGRSMFTRSRPREYTEIKTVKPTPTS